MPPRRGRRRHEPLPRCRRPRHVEPGLKGRSTRQALAALAADEATTSVIVVSKPPAAEVLADMQAYAAGLGVPVHWATWAQDARPHRRRRGRPGVPTGTRCRRGRRGPRTRSRSRSGRCAVSSAAAPSPTRRCFASATLGGIRSNIPSRTTLALGADLRDDSHVVIDFGDDTMTQGRAHPMIDPSLRLERIAAEAKDPTCGVLLLLDLVLGYGAHQDPADELAQAISDARATAQGDGRGPARGGLPHRRRERPPGPGPLRDRAAAGRRLGLPLQRQATRHALSCSPPPPRRELT